MEPVVITSENFEDEVLKSDKPVLADFWAEWCGPCKMLSPVVDEIAGENDEIKVVKVNVDDNQELAMQFKTMSIPTLIVFKDGKETNRSVGVISKSQILDLVK
ncbi:MAG: thioredoxin [Eubacterium sp.]|nr:thioredoxin [Eubacterium sp.]